MSVRAHRVLEIKTVAESFNLWHDGKLCNFIDQENDTGFWHHLNADGCGLVELNIETIKKILENSEKLEVDEYDIEDFKKALEWAQKNNTEWVQYYCY